VSFTITARYDAGNWQTYASISRKKQNPQTSGKETVNSSEINRQADNSSFKTQQNQLFIYFCVPGGREKKVNQHKKLLMH